MKRPEEPTSFKSERDQDAFLAWLLYFGNISANTEKEYDFLHPIACEMIKKMINEEIEVEAVAIEQQVPIKEQDKITGYIDLLAIVNNQYAIIIEDKTETVAHDNQLNRYAEYVRKLYKGGKIRCVYYKSGNECHAKIKNMTDNYTNKDIVPLKILTRKEILKDIIKIKSKECDNKILKSYIAYLEKIEELTCSYKDNHVSIWGSRAWEGFCMDLESDTKLAELCPQWKHQTNDGGIVLTLDSIHIGNTGAELFLQLNGYVKNLKNTCLIFRIMGSSSNPKMPKNWNSTIETVFNKKEENRVAGLKSSISKRKIKTIKTARRFARLSGIKFFGTDTVKVAAIADKFVQWHKKLQELANELSKTEATQSDK